METKLKNLKVGEQFIINGNTYTKLNEQGYCLLDEHNNSAPTVGLNRKGDLKCLKKE